MPTYNKLTNFTAKDSLPTSDSLKILRGSEFDAEFQAISTAIGDAADAASPTLTGTATAANLTVTGTLTVSGNIDGGTY